MLVASLCSCHPQGVPEVQRRIQGRWSSHKTPVLRALFRTGHAEAAKRKRSVVKINASALWWSASTDLGIPHSLFFLSWHHCKTSPPKKKKKKTTSGTEKRDSWFLQLQGQNTINHVNHHPSAACDTANASICSISKEKDRLPTFTSTFPPPPSLFRGRKKRKESNKIYISLLVQCVWVQMRLLPLQNKHRKTKLSIFATPCRSIGAYFTCLNSDSSPSCIIHTRIGGAVHSSLCVNGLSASLRLRVQLRGESLLRHLTVLFLSCCVI